MAAQLCNCETTVLHRALPHKLNKIIEEGRSPTALFRMDTLTTSENCLHQRRTICLLIQFVLELTTNFNWSNALCIQELYHRPNLGAAGEGIRASISDNCYHATGTRRNLSG
ncbi:hypothetical protein TNCV_313901 [Trichonephila clavipes]|nr:hypothetical protein TNCV_313901 [Trichonephila clavipes]